MIELAKAYLQQAKHDIESANIIKNKPGFEDWVFWMIFQSMELAIKSVLIALGNQNTKGMKHELHTLVKNLPEEAKKYLEPLSSRAYLIFQKFNNISPYPEKKDNKSLSYKLAFQSIEKDELIQYNIWI